MDIYGCLCFPAIKNYAISDSIHLFIYSRRSFTNANVYKMLEKERKITYVENMLTHWLVSRDLRIMTNPDKRFLNYHFSSF